ncbi:mitochondrial fission process protein 1 [Limosa lapponica baueri]|uniref:Mitochondrial fission process protein 1 n=1 Tax=Limosa lapponica baueri TaxID=1758121 RepID=A0A2I0TQI0_LIMLA|nr:mitochondrial fission process protein 1 [Limosa lapponica baueri]
MKRDYRVLGQLVKGSGTQVVFSIPPVAAIDERISRKSHQIKSWLQDWCNRQDFGFFDHGLIYRTPGLLATAQLKCIYLNACIMVNKQEELEAIVQQENYDIGAITETWWEDSQNWSAAIDDYQLFRRDRQGRRGGGVVFYVRDRFECLELNNVNASVECLWVRIKEKANKADIMVGICYRPPNQDVEADKNIL